MHRSFALLEPGNKPAFEALFAETERSIERLSTYDIKHTGQVRGRQLGAALGLAPHRMCDTDGRAQMGKCCIRLLTLTFGSREL